MATIVPVHGTFAHIADARAAEGPGGDARQWWEPGSAFEADIGRWVESEAGPVTFEPFVWDGANSELSRRAAGAGLLDMAHRMDKAQQPYVLIGHSHGGSVIASALQEAASRRKPLGQMKRWISVGTPFVNLRKEMFLFSRIPMVLQAIYVALLLFVVMFLLPLLLGLSAGDETRNRYMGLVGLSNLDSLDGIATLAITTLTISSVFIVFYILLLIMDRRMLRMHSRSNIERTRSTFGGRWLGLVHEDDEVVQGLRSLGTRKFSIFDRSFFVPALTAMAVFALPVAYVVLLFSPGAMTGITSFLKSNVYKYDSAKVHVDEAKALRDEFRKLRTEMLAAGVTLRDCWGGRTQQGGAQQGRAQQGPAAARAAPFCARARTAQRRFAELRKAQPELPRVLRFEAAYLDPKTGQLQGDGRDIRVNSWMLFNLLNDTVTRTLGVERWVGDDGQFDRGDRQMLRMLRFLVPALVVPMLLALSAVLVLFLVYKFGGIVSGFIAQAFDWVTWRQIKRSALGNDTTTEVAESAAEKPYWLDRTFPYLPEDLAQPISDFSDKVAAESLGKFRGAISTLVLSDAPGSSTEIATHYFSWKELVHSAYFDVPQFRKFVVYAISQTDGFRPTAAFKADPDFQRLAVWYAALAGGTAAQPQVSAGPAATAPVPA